MLTATDLKKLEKTFAAKEALTDIQIRINSKNGKISAVIEELTSEVKSYRKDLALLDEQRENLEERIKRIERKLLKSY